MAEAKNALNEIKPPEKEKADEFQAPSLGSIYFE